MNAPLHRRRAFYFAAAAGAAAWLAGAWLAPALAVTIGADVFFALYLVLALGSIRRLTADFLKHNADSEDEPVWVIFSITLATAIVAIVSLFVLINRKTSAGPIALGLTLASLPLGWFTIHTMAALHYAHLYWQRPTARQAGKETIEKPRRGLEFPGTMEPGGLDFLYFAFVIAMAAQTSDVVISHPYLRFTCLIHSIVSFIFNTVLVAAAVNVVVSLG